MNAALQRAVSQCNRFDPRLASAPEQPVLDAKDRLRARIHSSGRKGAWVGASVLGGLSAPSGAGYRCARQTAVAGDKVLAWVMSAPSLTFCGSMYRSTPAFAARPVPDGWPATVCVAHRAEKIADLLSALYAVVFESIPWQNVRVLVTRLPSANFPQACDPRRGAPQCPDVLSWDRAARITPHVEAVICIVTGVVVGAFLGAVVWRDGAAWIAKIPAQHIPQGAVDALARSLPEARPALTLAASGLQSVVKAANDEVTERRRLQKEIAAAASHENAPTIASDV